VEFAAVVYNTRMEVVYNKKYFEYLLHFENVLFILGYRNGIPFNKGVNNGDEKEVVVSINFNDGRFTFSSM
jgi:hypothetical protein